MTLLLRPLDTDNPPDGLVPQRDLRGIAIHWRESPAAEPTAAPWSVQRIAFHAVHPKQEDRPPTDADEQRRFVLAAYALSAGQHPIPSDAEIIYEVRW